MTATMYFPFEPTTLNPELREGLQDFLNLKESDEGWQVSYSSVFDYLKNNYSDCEELNEFLDWLDSFLTDSEDDAENLIEQYLSLV